MYDILITGGTVVDGTGARPASANVAVADGRIVEVGPDVDGQATQTIDADGALVAPGWVDVHTHYDGQVTWDDELAPSSMNGVTTVVTGNCGVGFAPVTPGREQTLIELMEGVEDIPGAALTEGVPWGAWEGFDQYLDHLGERAFALDVGTQIPHGALRFYVMGDRGQSDEDATPTEAATQARLVGEALAAGALGFSSSRTIGHRSLWGQPVPGTFAPEGELLEIGLEMARRGSGVIEVIPASTVGPLDELGGERSSLTEEVDLMGRLSIASGRPVTFTLVQSAAEPDLWREVLDQVDRINAAGARLRPQVPSRPVSVLTGLSSYHAFMRKPTYLEHLADLPLAERAVEMARPEVRQRLMEESSVAPDAPGSMDNLYGLLTKACANMVPVDEPADYLGPATNFGDVAATDGREPIDVMYDFLLTGGGTRFARLRGGDPDRTREVLRTMLTHEATVTGLSDAGAHVTMICDGTMPTTQLGYWGRDADDELRIPVEDLIHKQTARNASLYGLADRGVLTPGLRADLNVIDLDNLRVSPPVAVHDLPAGGTRLIQPVNGYVATMCAGVVTRRDDVDTGARPGRLIRR